jgi:hypothetical protein
MQRFKAYRLRLNNTSEYKKESFGRILRMKGSSKIVIA